MSSRLISKMLCVGVTSARKPPKDINIILHNISEQTDGFTVTTNRSNITLGFIMDGYFIMDA